VANWCEEPAKLFLGCRSPGALNQGTCSGFPTELPREQRQQVPYSAHLAREFHRRRIQAGLSQDDVRAKAGLGSQNLVSGLERDIPDKPAMEDLVKLGSVYGMTPNDIARLAGWWDSAESLKWDPALEDVQRGLAKLAPEKRREFVDIVLLMFGAFRAQALNHGKSIRRAAELMGSRGRRTNSS